MDHIGQIETELAKLEAFGEDGMTPHEIALTWTAIGTAAASALKDLGFKVIEPEPELEPVGPLKYGWASTPDEVALWCEANGVPYVWDKGKVLASFDDKPDLETRKAMSDSGFHWDKFGKSWDHICGGSWSTKKNGEPTKAAIHRAHVDAGSECGCGSCRRAAA